MDFSKYLGEVGLTALWNLMMAELDSRLFIGTRAEYEANATSIPVGAFVIITDESDVVLPPIVEPEEPTPTPPPAEDEPTATMAILGQALLGQMILGQLK